MLYTVKIQELAALFIINIKIHLTIKKSTSTINAHISVNMTKSQDEKKKEKKKEKKFEEEAQILQMHTSILKSQYICENSCLDIAVNMCSAVDSHVIFFS